MKKFEPLPPMAEEDVFKSAEQMRQENTLALARDTMLGDTITAVLGEIKAAKDVWQKLGQDDQDEALERIEKFARSLLMRLVEIIASDGRPTIVATVDSVTVKDGLKAVLSLSRASDRRHALVDAQGSQVLIVIADAEPYCGGEKPKSEAEQKQIEWGEEL